MHILTLLAFLLTLAAIGLAIAALIKSRGKDHYAYTGQEAADNVRDSEMMDYEISQAISPSY